jgi:hypothetical protein
MKRSSLLLLSSVALFAVACELPIDGGEDYREPIPTADEVSARLPGPTAGGASRTGAMQGKRGGEGQRPFVYELVRRLASDADAHSRALSGLVFDVVHTPPGSVQGRTAVWGPVERPGFTAEWRVSVTDAGNMEYDYVLEGRPRAARGDDDFRVVLRGRGYGRAHARHHAGVVTIDNDAYRAIEPELATATGTTKITYDFANAPGAVAIEARPKDARRWADLKVSYLAEGGGELELTGVEDFQDDDESSRRVGLAELVLRGRWSKDGAGRADALVTGSDLPAPAKISECWSPSYSRVYVRRNNETSGNVSSCAFQDPAL